MIRFPEVGELFDGRFQLLELIGKGALGTVFRAKQLTADREVALKVLDSNFGADGEFISRFKREAHTLSSLQHENIVTIYSMGVSDSGFPYLSMELINGLSIRKIIEKEGTMEPKRCIKLLSQCCDALDYIHSKQVVHRDLKPENMIVMNPGTSESPKLIDFGLVQLSIKTDEQNLTATGEIVGTIAYMSPEQCQSATVDQRSDIYSICACFYEMLSGKAPFEGQSAMAVMYMHMHDTIPQLKQATGLSSLTLMNSIIKKGMAKDPTHRYQSAKELKAEMLLLEKQLEDAEKKPSLKLGFLCAALVFVILASLMLKEKIQQQKSEKNLALSSAESNAHQQHQIDPSRQYSRNKKTSDQINELMLKAHRFANHGADREALETVKEAYDYSQKHAETKNLLKWKMRLATYYYAVGQTNETIELCKAVIEADPQSLKAEGINYTQILDVKSLLASTYLDTKNEKEARIYLKELCDPENCVKQANFQKRTLACLLRLHEYTLAEQFINNEKIPSYYPMLAAICRRLNQPALADYCLSSMPADLLENSLVLQTEYAVEAAYNALSKNNRDQARKILTNFLNGAGKTIVPETVSRVDTSKLLFCLRQLGMYEEALSQARRLDNNSKEFRVMIADNLIFQGKLDEAQKVLKDSDEIIDPESNKIIKAQQRVQNIKAGKADKLKGLVSAYD